MLRAATLHRPIAILILAVASLASVGCNPAAGLHGQWQVDASGWQAQLAKGQGNRIVGAAAKLMSLANVEVQFEFKPDGSCEAKGSLLGQSKTLAGKWRFVKREGNSLYIGIKMEDDAEEREIQVTLIDNDHIEMPLPMNIASAGGQKVPFTRIEPQE